jgi:four helix bundle protein
VGNTKIQSFKDLITWQKSVDLVINTYSHLKSFPKEEIFGLSSQIKRAVVSVPANIAEGFSRFSPKDKARFYFIALGSLTEIQSHFMIAARLKFLSRLDYDQLQKSTIEISKLINSLIKGVR